jgi:putative MATE family efflux protein
MIRFAIPIILTGILQNLYNTADTLVVGNFGGTSALASVGAAGSTTSLVVNVAVQIFIGMNIILARHLGAGDHKAAKMTCSTGYVTSLMLGILLLVVGQLVTVPMLNLTKCPTEIMPWAETYLRIYFCGVPALMFNNYASSVLRMSCDSRSPFIYLSISGVVNVIFNIVFVLVFGNPVVGVALSTILAMYISTVQFVLHLVKMEGPCKLELIKLSFDFHTFGKIVRYGIPSCISSATFSLTSVIIQPAINSFREIGISGSTASSSIEAYLYSITASFNSAVVSFMGQNIGAGNKERTVKVLKTAYGIAIALMAVYTILVIGLGRQLLWFFIPGEENAIKFGQLRLTFIMSAAVINGIMNVNSGALQAYGFTIGQMMSNLIGVCLFRIIWMFTVYPTNPVPWMLWLCYPVTWTLTAIGVFSMVVILTRKYIKGKEFKL